jgi:hypothetical protein
MQVVDANGNVFGQGLEITGIDGKPKVPVINTDITIGTTVINGGVSGRLLFDDAGVVGETAGINWNPSTSTLSLFDSPFVSQAGNSSANTSFSITGTASSNYTIYSSRQFIFNTGQSMYFNTDTDGGSALDRAWYFAGARTGMTGGRTYGALTVDSSGFPSFTLYNNDNGPRILLASNATSYFNGGNLLVGTTTDAGFKLDVNGSSRVTSLKTADIFPASANISLWTNSLNASSRFYTAPVHQDGRINFNAVAGGSDQVLIRAWHTGSFALGTGSSAAGGALTVRGDTLLIGTSGALFIMAGTFGPNNVPYRLGISTNATTTSFYTGVTNNLTNIESSRFEYTAVSHTFYTGTTTGNQSNPSQYTPLTLSNLGNVGIGSAPGASKLWLDGGIFTKKYYTNTSSQTINFGSGYEIFGTVHASEGYMFYLNPVGWASGWGLRIGNSTNYHQFESSGFRTSSVTTESLSLGGGIVSYYKSSPASGFSFSSGGGWDFVLRGTSDEKFRVKGNGNFLINTSTDAGYKLDVNGTGRFKTTDTSIPLTIAHSGSVGIQIEANANGYRMRLASNTTYSDISTPDSYLTLNQSGQKVTVGSSTTYNSAQLAVDSTTRGFLPPRMTNAQMLAIATPSAGLIVYDTTNNKHYGYDGTTWNPFY